MKKNIVSKFLLVSLLASAITSCYHEDVTGDSVVVTNRGAHVEAVDPYLNVDGVSTFNEGGVDREVKFSVVLSEPQPVDIYVTVSAVAGGTAEEGVDYDYDHEILIPKWSSSAEGTVIIYGDGDVEGVETFELSVGVQNDANIDLAYKTLSFVITDYGDLNLEFDFCTTIPGYPVTICDIGYDADFIVVDANGDDVSGYQAATGAAPESMVLSLADLADGEYTIIEYIYDDATLSTIGLPTFNIPVIVNYSRDNSTFGGSFVQDTADQINSDFGSDPGWTTPIYVATLTVENGLFTISKNGSVLGTGRMSNNSGHTTVKTKVVKKTPLMTSNPYFN